MQRNYKLQLGLLFLLLNIFTYAQVGIGLPDPDRSAMLQVSSANKGVLLPSVALASVTDNTTVSNPADGLIVWNNGSGSLKETGFYYWFTSKWNRLSTNTSETSKGDGDAVTGWNTTGTNSGNYSGADTNLSLGTKTRDDLIFKVNSTTAGRLGVDNSVSLGLGANAGQNGIAIGSSSSAFQGVSIGSAASVSANDALAIGNKSSAGAFKSTAIGYGAQTSKNESTAIGNQSSAGGFQSIALGYNAKTNSNSETAVGYNAVTNSENSTALGSGANALGQYSTAIGYGATTSQANTIVLGNNNVNVGIGTGAPNISAKLDVNGQFKLGEKGSVQKNQISFEVWPGVSINNMPPGKSVTLDITVPAGFQPASTRAVVVVSPAGDFAGNSTFSISNPRMTSTSTITINLTNISGSAGSLNSGHFYVMINEF
ncbi:hypothetical protein C1637_21425 [Chryseobacterium lactis]|uniref:Trimeric autotransporter adhesin YadA-like head domain-containing protein n=1 Tax=Chryseobacterium lactis TaxID=1241981 RepID=A0A3G6RNR1_CHRLC|nr:hypothetical protein [Chryseobacterium lactis]AZA83369.1 hypothetical protein EG342_16435 [Chryseobacterium lactis]AZB03754.1 hypothetical protein EG341_07310 [Chryseobacterium lactis]PNW11670.1 hypothetical protein C1637_21425 [Chryseobacterium lactis]